MSRLSAAGRICALLLIAATLFSLPVSAAETDGKTEGKAFEAAKPAADASPVSGLSRKAGAPAPDADTAASE